MNGSSDSANDGSVATQAGDSSDSDSSDSTLDASGDSSDSDSSDSSASASSDSSDSDSSDSSASASSDSSDSDSSDSSTSASGASSTPASSAWPDAAAGGWNASIRTVSGWSRVPVAGLKSVNFDPSTSPAAEGSAANRAIAWVPSITASAAIEILVHLHGHNIGQRQRTSGTNAPGTVRDVAVDAIPDQLAASGRQMIALLPQGTLMSGFAPAASASFDIPAFISEALDALVSAGVLAEKPPVSGVILSGHSGGGGALSMLLAQAGTPHVPAVLEAEFLFEGINGPNELATQTTYLVGRLNADLAAVKSATDAPAALAYLAGSFRFAGFYDSQYYVPYYTQLKTSIDAWFAKNAGALGGTSDPTYVALRANYAITMPSPAVVHDEMVDHGNLLAALKMLP